MAGGARASGRGGRRAGGGGRAQAGPQPSPPAALAAASASPGRPAPAPSRPPRLPRFRAAGRASPPPRVASRPLPVFRKLPRAAGQGAAGPRRGEYTEQQMRRSGAREVRGPPRRRLAGLPGRATHPLRPGDLAGHPRGRPRAAAQTLQRVRPPAPEAGDTGTARRGGPRAPASQVWGGAVRWRTLPSDAAAAPRV